MRAKQLRRGFLISILLLIAFWLASLIWGLAEKAQVAVGEARSTQWQYEALEKRKAALEANLSALSTERGQDAAIRTSFGVAKPGEEVIVVVPSIASTAPTTTPPWWQEILDWF